MDRGGHRQALARLSLSVILYSETTADGIETIVEEVADRHGAMETHSISKCLSPLVLVFKISRIFCR